LQGFFLFLEVQENAVRGMVWTTWPANDSSGKRALVVSPSNAKQVLQLRNDDEE